MALTTPILYTISAFDSTNEQNFTFNVIGGSQVVANKLTIKDNTTLSVIYEETQTTYKFQHTLPSGTLTNGNYYQATIQTQDAEGNLSNTSNIIQFYCYTQPTFEFTNIPVNNLINNSSFNFEVTYNQTQGEILNAYVFNLYSASGALISTSNTQYNTNTSLPLTISYLFSGFEDSTQYQIQCTGVTTQGTQIDTGTVTFNVAYIQPSIYSYFFLTNNCDEGYITFQSNVVGVPGTSNPTPPIFIDGKEVDLTTDGSYVQWSEGFEVEGNWTASIWGRNFVNNKVISQFTNNNGDNIYIYYRNNGEDTWAELKVIPNGWQFGYNIYSTSITAPTIEEQIFIWVRNIDNLYDIEIQNLGTVA